jgi:AcrR family transcriptional regulator
MENPVVDGNTAPLSRPMRADAQRNYDRILAAAGAAIARDGADASLEKIARRAGVGSATLHRHFPSRQALLEAVFRAKVEALCHKARSLTTDPDPGVALVTWLRQARAIRPGVAIVELLKLANAIAMATEREPDGAAEADRLLTLAINGVHPVT